MWISILQGIAGLMAALFGYLWYQSETHVTAIEGTETSPIGSIQGAGYHEVKGVVRCEEPLKAPRTEDPVVFYHFQVTQTVRETYRDDDGGMHTETSTREVQNDARSTAFEIEDGTGRLHVAPDGAQFKGVLIHSRDYTGNTLGGGWGSSSSGQDVVGTQERVHAIPVDRDIYAIGFTREGGEAPVLMAHPEGKKPYILSALSEEELTAAENSSATGYMLLTIACAFGALYPLLKSLR